MLGPWLALALCASPAPAELSISGERLLRDGQRLLTTVEGGARLDTDGAAVNADRLTYDETRRVVTAVGHVVVRLVRGGKIAIVADVVTLRLDEANAVQEIFLLDGVALSKKDLTNEQLLAADTADAAKRVGGTQALLEGNHLVREGEGRWAVDRLELVPCECNFEDPSWSITSHAAVVDTENDRVSVTHPVVRIRSVPVLWLPWLSLPLTDRQSGLLFPKPGGTQLNGFSWEQPVFFTLGRSADVTLTPGYFAGGLGPYGVRGPRLLGEFRYVPSRRASGRLGLGALYDFRLPRDVEFAGIERLNERRGLRGEWSWQHTQDLDHGFGFRADVAGHSDGDYNRDITPDVIASAATYLRSSAVAFQRGDSHLATLEVGLRQDIQWGYDWLGNGRLLVNAEQRARFGPGTLQRLPALTLAWAPMQRLGPFRFDVQAEALRLAPLFSLTGDEGQAAREGELLPETFATSVSRLFSPSVVGPEGLLREGVGDRAWQPGEREGRHRLSVLPRASFGATLFDAVSVSGLVAWRQLAWQGLASGNTWSRGYPILGARVETQLARDFGSVRHVLQPAVELRSVPVVLAGASDATAPSPVAYDALDAALPAGLARTQAIAELRQRLGPRGSPEWLRLDLGQGFDLVSPAGAAGLAESYGRVASRVGWFAAQGVLRIDPVDGAVTRLQGRLDLDDGRGHSAYGAYENILMEGTARTRQPLDLLFLREKGYTSTTRLQQVVFGARWNFGPVGLRYDALVMERLFAMATTPTLALVQHTLGVAFTPACDCWRLEVAATQRLDAAGRLLFPDFGASLSVSRFGSIGAGTR
jgi:LPS-assembly protein